MALWPALRDRAAVGVTDDVAAGDLVGARARGSGGMSWLPSSGDVRLPLHRRDRERRSLADPARRGKSAWVRKPVRSAPTVGHLQGDVFVEWSALDRIPSVIFLKRPHYRCPVTNSAMACSISRVHQPSRPAHRFLDLRDGRTGLRPAPHFPGAGVFIAAASATPTGDDERQFHADFLWERAKLWKDRRAAAVSALPCATASIHPDGFGTPAAVCGGHVLGNCLARKLHNGAADPYLASF
jgi:hypothetical protein